MRPSLLLALIFSLLLTVSFSVDATADRRQARLAQLSLVNSLPLDDTSLVEPVSGVVGLDPRYSSNVTDGWVTRRALVAFNSTVSAQLKEDLLNSLLYAQLKCRTVDSVAQPEESLSCVRRELSLLVWMDKAATTQTQFKRNASQPLAEDVLSVVERAVDGGIAFAPDYRRLARSAAESLKVEDAAFQSWHNYSTNGTSNLVELFVASVEQDDLVVWSASYYVTTTAQSEQLLWSYYPQGDATLKYFVVAKRTQYTAHWTETFRQKLRTALDNFLPQSIQSKTITL